MAESMDLRARGDFYAWAEEHIGLDDGFGADFGVVREENGLGRDQGHA